MIIFPWPYILWNCLDNFTFNIIVDLSSHFLHLTQWHEHNSGLKRIKYLPLIKLLFDTLNLLFKYVNVPLPLIVHFLVCFKSYFTCFYLILLITYMFIVLLNRFGLVEVKSSIMLTYYLFLFESILIISTIFLHLVYIRDIEVLHFHQLLLLFFFFITRGFDRVRFLIIILITLLIHFGLIIDN